MSDRVIPALLAVAGGFAAAALLFVPWVVYRYRRRGSLGSGDALISLAAVVYGLALITFTILPLPERAPDFCRTHDAAPQVHPLAFVSDVMGDGGLHSPLAILTNPAAAQVVLNVLFFIPLGMLVRHLFHRGIVSATLIGLGASLFVEVTQLTGDWFLYPCAYRIFDVDDLAANGLGALFGALIAALLRLVPGQRSTAPSVPRPVTASRRLLGMAVDLVAAVLVTTVTTVITVTITLIGTALGGPHGDRLDAVTDGIGWVAVIGHLIVVLITGRTFGEVAVRLRPVPTLGPGARIVRWLFGIGGVLALSAAGSAFTAFIVAVILAVIAIGSRGHRGLGYLLLRRELEDDRTAPSAQTSILEPEHRGACG